MQPQSVSNLGVYGLIRQAEVDDRLIPSEGVTEVINFHFDRKGAATTRPGLTGIGSTIASQAAVTNGLHNAQSTALLVAVNYSNGTVGIYRCPDVTGGFTFQASGWGVTNGSNGWSGSAKIRFVDFLGNTIPLLGGATYGQTSIDASAWPFTNVTGGAPLNMSNFNRSASVGEVYKSRMYLTGDTDFPNRLFFSSVVSSNNAINWSPTTDYVDINPGDGESISSLKRYSLELLVFKPNYIYRFRTAGLDPDPLIRVGTRSHESVVEGKRGLYFFHDTGFYRYSGGYPIEISRAISDIVAVIPFSQFDDVAGWKDSDHIYWSLGNLTVNDVKGSSVWRNVVVRYTESSDIWTVYSYASDARRGSPFVTATSSSIVVGLDNGRVAEFNKGTIDIEHPIKYRLITKWYEWEGIEQQKVLQMIVGVCEKAQGGSVMYQTNENAEWHSLGQLNSFLTYFDNLKIKFNRIRFKLTGVTRDESSVFMGLEVPLGIVEGIVK